MSYEGMIIRPPSEAYSILLQATVGCSHNKCSFCGTYKDKRFRIKDDQTIFGDLAWAAKYCRQQDRLFIMDGDALIIPQPRLVAILAEIRDKLPWVKRVGTYANSKGIKMKTDEELVQLRELGLKIIYLGVESGDDVVLQKINKGATAQKLIDMGRRVKAAGIKLSVTVLLGIGGRERSMEHARNTGRLLTAMDPDYVGALMLMILDDTSLGQEYRAGRFTPLEPLELLKELREMFVHTDLSGGLFFANHASNYLPIKARLPRDKAKTIKRIDEALSGQVALRPEWMRAL
ncbi:MAG: radical SAM protein [Deltaproteobacteria bacterium]|nr:radical SAM protein [Deltaproteobacteria bacterium]